MSFYHEVKGNDFRLSIGGIRNRCVGFHWDACWNRRSPLFVWPEHVSSMSSSEEGMYHENDVCVRK